MSDHDTADRELVAQAEDAWNALHDEAYTSTDGVPEESAELIWQLKSALARRIAEGERHAAFRQSVCEVLADATPPPVGGVSVGRWSLRTPREIRERLAALVAEEPPR